MSQATKWFDVDKEGLSKLLERQGKAHVIFELVQNAWDEDSKNVRVTLKTAGVRGRSILIVEDDNPEGFKDIRHAYTLFAESGKKNNSNKRGRFNLGEKLVLALCTEAEICTVGNTVRFKENGDREIVENDRESGSMFMATVKMTKSEREGCIEEFNSLLAQPGIDTYINGRILAPKDPVRTTNSILPTIAADEEGRIFETARKTDILIYNVGPDQKPYLYEMGIPVVEIDGKFSVDIHQKVPMNMNRDNVKPAYMRKVNTVVMNATYDLLDSDDVNDSWVKDATEHKDIDQGATIAFLDMKFGTNRAKFDPSDLEANKIATASDIRVIGGRALSKAQWENVNTHAPVQPTGQITPSPKAWSGAASCTKIPTEEWTDGMKNIRAFCVDFAARIMGVDVSVQFFNESQTSTIAAYGGRELTFNIGRLGYKWFNEPILSDVVDLVIHEFGHEYEPDHLSDKYYRALTGLSGKSTQLALDDPDFFQRYFG